MGSFDMLDKNEARKRNRKIRDELQKSVIIQKSQIIENYFLKSDIYNISKVIMLYMPLGNEVDTGKIFDAAICDGKQLVFPVTDKKSGIITPFYASADTKFSCGAFSVMEPKNTSQADALKIDVFVVPGIAFDKSGVRVGFGKGCYDRLLKNVNATKIGFCYDFQVCDEIKHDEHDVKMDFLLTESGFIVCK